VRQCRRKPAHKSPRTAALRTSKRSLQQKIKNKKMTFESTAIQNYLTTIQGVINRMAGNSASCKNWCISIVTAILVFSTSTKQPQSIWVALVPCILFAWLDAYYLSIERQLVQIYREAVKKVQNGTMTTDDLYNIKTNARGLKGFSNSLSAFNSLSVLPFYILTAISIVALAVWIKP
jgi:hypothetical protein